jgi:hypothetical protein
MDDVLNMADMAELHLHLHQQQQQHGVWKDLAASNSTTTSFQHVDKNLQHLLKSLLNVEYLFLLGVLVEACSLTEPGRGTGHADQIG